MKYCQWRRSDVFMVNFEHIFTPPSSATIINFEHVIAVLFVEPLTTIAPVK